MGAFTRAGLTITAIASAPQAAIATPLFPRLADVELDGNSMLGEGATITGEAVVSAEHHKYFVGLSFDTDNIERIVETISTRTALSPYAFAVTPNVDHVVRLHDSRDPYRNNLAAAYNDAQWRLCDSRILARLALLRSVRIPIVPGSDLTERLFADVIKAGDVICVVGGTAAMAASLGQRFPDITIHHHAPPMGMRDNQDAMGEAAEFIEQSRARFTFIAVGSPQQEMLADLVFKRALATGTVLCVGAAIAFLTGYSRRAPRWMQFMGLEWMHRLISDPKRLWRRYLIEGPRIFRIAFQPEPTGSRLGITAVAPGETMA